jgi:hypothetical protein
MKFIQKISYHSWLNFLIFQWTCFRLLPKYNIETNELLGWGFLGPILPLTGWWSKFIFITFEED